MLAECFEHSGFDGTAQADLGWHTHNHRPVGGENGLGKMAEAVTNALTASFDRAGIQFGPSELRETYLTVAREHIDGFEADAAFNGLEFDRDHEHEQVEHYADRIGQPPVDLRLPSFAESGLDADTILESGDCAQLR